MGSSLKSLIDQFERAYIINLPERVDRRNDVIREFEAIGITIPNEKVRFYAAVRPSEQGDFYSLGARGSFNSHRSVLALAESEELKNVLVFEDDVSFRQPSPMAVAKISEGLREIDWDVIYFGYLEPSAEELTGPLLAWPKDTLGGHFYAVNQRFMRKMVQYMDECEARPRNHPKGGPMSRDGAFNHIRYVYSDIRVLLAVPNLAFQRSSRTDIGPLRSFDRVIWLQPVIKALRNLKTRLRMKLDRIRDSND